MISVLDNIPLTKQTVGVYAASNYDKSICRLDEVLDDLAKTKRLARIFRKFQKDGYRAHHEVVNTLKMLRNIFGVRAMLRLVCFEVDEDCYGILKAYLKKIDVNPTFVIGAPQTINFNNVVSNKIIEEEIVGIK